MLRCALLCNAVLCMCCDLLCHTALCCAVPVSLPLPTVQGPAAHFLWDSCDGSPLVAELRESNIALITVPCQSPQVQLLISVGFQRCATFDPPSLCALLPNSYPSAAVSALLCRASLRSCSLFSLGSCVAQRAVHSLCSVLLKVQGRRVQHLMRFHSVTF